MTATWRGDRDVVQRFLATRYLAAQAGATGLWWIAMASVPAVRGAFELAPGHPAVLDAYLPADVAVFGIGSALAAWALSLQRDWAPMLVAATAGGALYATLQLVAWAAAGGRTGLGLAAMAAATAATGGIAITSRRLSA